MGASRINQIGIYVGKQFRMFKNEKGWKSLIFSAVISLLVSAVLSKQMLRYDMETWTGFFTVISACIWIGLFNSIQAICKERQIIKREHRTGLHISSYFISHVIYQAVLCIAEALILLLCTALFISYPVYSLIGNSFIEYFLTYFLVLLAADILGLAISAIVKTTTAAMMVMPFILIIQLIFSGVLFQISGPLENVSALTLSRWGLNAACISADYNDLNSTEKRTIETYLNESVSDSDLPVTEEMVHQAVNKFYEKTANPDYEYTSANLMTQWGILLLHCLAYSVIGIVALEFVDKDRR